MKILNKNAFLEISVWIHRNARPIQLAMWDYLYEEGKGEAVIEALTFYQNQDGGFGNGLEADCWNTESSPYTTLKAIELLRKARLVDVIGSGHSLIQGIFRYLESGVHSNEDGWLFCIPSNDNFPRAPWWTYSEETNKVQSMGVTAGLCAFILQYGAEWPELHKRALDYAGKICDKAADTDDFGEMGVEGIVILLEVITQCGLSSSFPCDGIMEKLAKAVDGAIERNPDNWQYYTPRPSGFIGSAECTFYKGNEEIVDTQLDYLIDMRKPDGVWDITWSWFDLGDAYSKEFAVSENWWKSCVAIDNMEFLCNFGRVDRY